MPYDGSLKFDTSIDGSGFEKGLNGIVSAVKGVALGYTGKKLADYLIGSNADMEQSITSFEVMLGSAEKAKALMTDLQNMANVTPFETTDLTGASQTLLSFGEDINNLQGDLKMLGDISQGNQEKFKSLALVFGQVQSAGKLMGQDLLQMINVGFNPLQVISKKTGESMADLRKDMEGGKISFEMVSDAMKTATSEGGLFYQSMEKQSKTMTGMVSTLKDYFAQAGRDAGNNAFEKLETSMSSLLAKLDEAKMNGTYDAIVNEVGDAINSLVTSLIKAAEFVYKYKDALLVAGAATVAFKAQMTINEIIAGVVNGFIAIKSALAGLKEAQSAAAIAQIALNTTMAINPIWLIASAVAALAAGLTVLALNADSASKTIKDYNKSMEQAKQNSDDTISKADAEIAVIQQKESAYEELRKKFEETGIGEGNLKAAAEELQKVLPTGTELIDKQTGAYKNLSGAIDNVVAKTKAQALLGGATEEFKTAVAEGAELDKKISDAEATLKARLYGAADYASVDRAKVDNGTWTAENSWTVNMARKDLKDLQDLKKQNETEQAQFKTSLEKYNSDIAAIEPATSPFAYLDQDARKGLKATAETVDQGTAEVSTDFKTFYDNLKQQKAAHIIDDKEYNSQLLKNLTTNNYDKMGAYNQYWGEVLDAQDNANKTALSEQKTANEKLKAEQKKTAEEIAKSQEKAFDSWGDNLKKLVTKTTNSLEEIAKRRQSLQEKLESFGSLFERKTVGTKDNVLVLSNIDESTQKLKLYQESLKSLKAAGASSDFMNEVASMDVGDATDFSSALLAKPNDELKAYLASWQENKDTAKQIASDYYQGEIDTVQKDFVDKFNAMMAQMPNDTSQVGADTIQGFINGLVSQSEGANGESQALMQSVIDTCKTALGVHSPSTVFAEIGSNVGDGFIQGLQSKTEEIRAAIKAAIGDQADKIVAEFQAAIRLEQSYQGTIAVSHLNERTAMQSAVPAQRASAPAQKITVECPVYLDRQIIAKAVIDDINAISYKQGKSVVK